MHLTVVQQILGLLLMLFSLSMLPPVFISAWFARLELSEDEKGRMTVQLDAILGYMDTLNALDTSGVEPTTTVIPMVSVMREDAVRPSLDREEALANAPDREDVYFRVPRIIED